MRRFRHAYTDAWASSILIKFITVGGVLLFFYLLMRNLEDAQTSCSDEYAQAIGASLCQDDDNLLNDFLSSDRVRCKEVFCRELIETGRADFIPLVKAQIALIKRLLPLTMNLKSLNVIVADPNFTIELVAENDFELTQGLRFTPNAAYLPVSNRILMCIDSDLSENQIVGTLRNELHHALIRATNWRKQRTDYNHKDPFTAAYTRLSPFLKKHWLFSKVKISRLQESIEDGYKRITKFEKLLQTPTKKLSPGQQKEREHYLRVFDSYDPLIHRDELPFAAYMELLEKVGYQKNEKNELLIADPIQFRIKRAIKRGDNIIMLYTTAISDTPVDKANSFIKDIREMKENIRSEGYKHLARHFQLVEHSSDLQEFSGETLKLFFPKWCEYIGEYTDIDDYCEAAAIRP